MSAMHFDLPYILYDDGSVYNHDGQPVLIRHYSRSFTMQVVQYPQQSAVVVPHAVHDTDTEDSDDEHEDVDDSDVQTQEDDSSSGQDSDGQDGGDDDYYDDDYYDDDDYEPDETGQGAIALTAESDDDFGNGTEGNGDEDSHSLVGTQPDAIDLTSDSEAEEEEDPVPAGFRRRVGGKSTWPGCTQPFYPAMIIEAISDAEDEEEGDEAAAQDPDIIMHGRLGSKSPLNNSASEHEVSHHSAGATGLDPIISTSPPSGTQASAIPKAYKPARKCPAEAYQPPSTSNTTQATSGPTPTPYKPARKGPVGTYPKPTQTSNTTQAAAGPPPTPYKPARKGPVGTYPNPTQTPKISKKRSLPDAEGSDDGDFEDGPRPSPPKKAKVLNKASSSVKKRANPKQTPSNAGLRAPRAPQAAASGSGTGTSTGNGPIKLNGPWIQVEKDGIEQIIRDQRQYEAQHKTAKALYDMRLFAMCSRELVSRFNYFRSPVACKNYWCRYGREKTGLDERNNAGGVQRALTTSSQGPKKGSAPKVKKPKAKKVEDEFEDEEDDGDVLSEDEEDDGDVLGEDEEDDDYEDGGYGGGYGGGQPMNFGGFPPEMMDAYED